MSKASEIRERLRAMKDDARAAVHRRFFKTGPGGYGEGDVFLGVTMPELRGLAREYEGIDLAVVEGLLASPIHEERMLALLLLVSGYRTGDGHTREVIYGIYLGHRDCINNWDLVDVSAEHVLGRHLKERDRGILHELARSPILWDRRMAVMATFHFIRGGEFGETLVLVETLLNDPHDLIHKACGWMLREIGKRSMGEEEEFLRVHSRTMPRTMLRYAIERFPHELRKRYLRGDVP